MDRHASHEIRSISARQASQPNKASEGASRSEFGFILHSCHRRRKGGRARASLADMTWTDARMSSITALEMIVRPSRRRGRSQLGCDFIVRPPALSKMKFLHCLCAVRVGRPSSKGVICQSAMRARAAVGDAVQGRQITFRRSLHPSLFLPWSRAARPAPLICAYFSPHRGTRPAPHFQLRLIHSARYALGSLKTGGPSIRPGLDLSEIDGYSIFGTH